MPRSRVLYLPAVWVGMAFFVTLLASAEQQPSGVFGNGSRPNIVLVLADDLGWHELGCYGNRFNETPNLDRLAAEGVRFTQAYSAAPVCSPDRVALMTGMHPARVGITDYLRPNDAKHLAREVVTVAEQLKTVGYTTGIIGKWHLTGYEYHGALEIGPDQQGFDEVICSERRGIGGGSYYWPYHFNPHIQRRLPDEYLVDRVNLEAVEFIERHRHQPFFLYVSHYAVHTRLVGKPDLVAKYEAKPGAGKGNNARRNNPHLAAQLESIDQGVGMIIKKLDELGLTERTILIFTSDNGGEDRVTTNGPLRAGKSTLYEGGIRVPLVVRFPGLTRPGSVCSQPVWAIDIPVTVLAAAGTRFPKQQPVDGLSLLAVLRDPRAPLHRDALYWHYPLAKPHFLGGRSAGAIRRGNWKLIQFFDTGQVELYDLENDLQEEHNLVEQRPEVAANLLERLRKWRKELGAEFPPGQPASLSSPSGNILTRRHPVAQ